MNLSRNEAKTISAPASIRVTDGMAARSAQAQLQRRGPIDATQTAMKITDAGGEEQAPDEAQHGVAEVAMQRRDGAADPAPETWPTTMALPARRLSRNRSSREKS